MLKNKTRIIVTEHEMLHLNATQILRVQNGQVTLVEPIGSNEHLDVSDSKLPPHSSLDFDIHEGVVKLTNSVASLLVEEEKEQGYLSADVFKSYWKASGGWIGFLVLCSVVLMQVTRNVSDVWLAHWVSQNVTTTSTYTSETSHFYLSIYASLAVSNSVITLFRSFLFAYAGIRAAKFIHNKMLNNVIMARFQFFDITPLGRILNRFSSDTYTIDDSLPFILNILLAQLAGLIGRILNLFPRIVVTNVYKLFTLFRCTDHQCCCDALANSSSGPFDSGLPESSVPVSSFIARHQTIVKQCAFSAVCTFHRNSYGPINHQVHGSC